MICFSKTRIGGLWRISSGAALAVLCLGVPRIFGEVSQLSVSVNHRYLQDAAGHPFFLVGDSPQNLPIKLAIEKLEDFMADCESKGFNLLWICIDGQRSPAPTPVPPIDRNNNLMMTSGWDISTLNDRYFVTIDVILNKANEHGIYCMLTPLSQCQWELSRIRANSASKWRDYGRYLGNRYKNTANIIWQFGNDDMETTSQHAIVRGIKDAGDAHLMTCNWRPGLGAFGSSWARKYQMGESWINLDAWYQNQPVNTTGAACYWQKREYQRPHPLPSFQTEPYYQLPFGKATDLECRMQNYYVALGGGCGGCVYGSGWLADEYDYSNYKNNGGRVQTIHFKKFFCSRDWWTLVPDYDHRFVTSGFGTLSRSTRDYVGAAINGGSLGIAYCPKSAIIAADLSKFYGAVTARWYDPTDGTFKRIKDTPLPNIGSQQFSTPGNNSAGDFDWVLVLESPGGSK